MLGLGMPEILFILVLALLIFGPKKLPEIGRTLGRGLGEFRRATNDLKRTFDSDIQALDREVKEPAAKIEPPAAAPAATVQRSEVGRPADAATADFTDSPAEPADEAATSDSAVVEETRDPA